MLNNMLINIINNKYLLNNMLNNNPIRTYYAELTLNK